ncbi:SMR family transporter [Vibrio cholerae]|uniref:DMT family transporter n=1 Tax=Vibrio cholerae TaxID=666 RepID=UPI00053BCDEC|nr:SMR family transporter [Vibrio cholerae]EGQ8204307.1 multidrug transporter [Vibrio cholerae]EGR1049231.1 multidrug transporter [Vibrio cholerae]EGR4347943.1 multidrug transporter [Vibrio cholerae]EJP6369657.1 multidrug transporter [Vibrio cholerae]ELK6278228.1 multidrug transporter [Vibrio cholerae]
MNWVILLLGVIFNAGASILIKFSVTPPRKVPTIIEPLSFITNWPILLGLIFYGVSFIFYTLALTRLPLNVAHPIMTSGAIAVVAILSIVIYKESMQNATFIGLFLIILGVWFIAYKGN